MQPEKMKELLHASVNETFMKTFGAQPDILYFEKFNDIDEECVISSIGFDGTLEGTCAICLPDSSACGLLSHMIHQKVTEVSADTVDGIGEIVNIVLGSIKMKLEKTPFDFTISVPSYIKGSRMVILSDIKKTTSIKECYSFNNIVFVISFMYREKPKENLAAKKKFAFAKLKTITEI